MSLFLPESTPVKGQHLYWLKSVLRTMIKENEIVTKKYFVEKTRDFVTKKYFVQKTKDFVTKKYLSSEFAKFHKTFGAEIRAEMKQQKYDIIKEVKIMMHDTVMGVMENQRTYYTAEHERYIAAQKEGYQDDLRVIHDGIKMILEKLDIHEKRITTLEHPAI